MSAEPPQAMPFDLPVITPPIAQIWQQALEQHQAGRLSEAEKLYRAILLTQPDHAEAHHNLGMLALQRGKPEVGLPHFQIAWETNPSQGPYWLSFIRVLIQTDHLDEARQVLAAGRQHGLAGAAVDQLELALANRTPAVSSQQDQEAIVGLFQAGRLSEAELLARDLTQRFPGDGFAWKVLGTILAQQMQSELAWTALTKALVLFPHDSETHNSLGVVLKSLGRPEEAAASYRRAVEIQPNCSEAHYNLGVVLCDLGRAAEAVLSYQQAVAYKPDYVQAHFNLGNAWQVLGRPDEAAASYQRALAIQPDYAEAHYNLGVALREAGRPDDAEASYRRALAIKPNRAETHNNLGIVLSDLGRVQEAVASYQRALAINPNHAETCHNLGNAWQDLGRMEEAVASYQRAVAIQPDCAATHSSLGVALQDLGRLDAALAHYRRAVEIQPEVLTYRSNLLFLYAFARIGSFQQEFAEARQWEQVALSDAERQAARDRAFDNPARQGRPLRLGIVSAELGQHAVSYFLTSFLGSIDRKRLTVLLYPTTLRRESQTASLRALAEGWSPLFGRSDAEAAAQIRADGVDILLDTTGHTRHCRLGIFAHRAAPVQCHHIGYAGTTGLSEMDYFLADPVLIPEALDGHFQETVWRLPRPWVAYAPLEEAPDPAWRPTGNGRLRLGSFNNLSKLSDSCLSLWTRVLQALPEATLLLKDKKALDRAIQGRIVDTLAEQGVGKDRVTFLPQVPDWRQHMATYDQLDIALDTVPFGSGTTGFDALWMGVPLITFAGSWMGGRMGASMLTGMGHPEWIAHTDEEYVAKVVALGRDEKLRAQLRSTQRQRMRASPLCDGRDMARALEDAFEAMFDSWWNNKKSPSRRTAAAPSSAATEAIIDLANAGRLSEAELAARGLTQQFPDDGIAWKLLGTVLTQQGPNESARAALQKATELRPHDSQAHNMLGVVLKRLGRLDEAVASYQRAVEHGPDDAQTHYNLGIVLQDMGRLHEAVTSYQRAVAIRADFAEAHNNLGNSLTDLGRVEEAVAAYRRAVALQPDYADALNNLSNALRDLGHLDEALAGYHRALEIKPHDLAYRSNLLFLYAFAQVGSFQQAFAAARQWEQVALSDAERQAARARVFVFENQPRQGRPLRLGIVSAELGQHAVSYFLMSFLGSIDRHRVTVLLYPTTSRGDAETAPLRALAEGWSPLAGRSDADAAAQIRADGVDILLDTTGHTQHCRLGIFAHRAAPVQCHYIGYACTTGLTEMDYFLADPVLIPAELDGQFQEAIWRLPRTWIAYAPLAEAPAPAWRPAEDGRIRVGSFNNLRKLSDFCLSLWARVLRALPEATLLLKDKMALDRAVQGRIVDTLAEQGVERERVTFLPRVPDWRQHMSLYDQLDIALDTIPFGSGTTGFDALWMGVPLITLAGQWMGGRMGASMLTGMGHPEWIAHTDEEYVAKVVALGRDEKLRAQLRSTQRQRMHASPLCDGRGMARALEDAFEAMYDQWWSRKQAPARQTVTTPSSAEKDALVGLFHAGRFAEAEAAARNLTQRFPGDGFAWKVLGTILAQIGQSESAWSALQKAIKQSPYDAEAHNALGVVLKTLGRWQEAVASFQQAVTIQPDSAEAHNNLGNVLRYLDRPDEAVQSYHRALAIQPDFAAVHYNLGIALRDVGRLDESIASYQRALHLKPNDADSYYNLGNALTDVGRLDEALASYRRALEIRPDGLAYRSNLLFLYSFARIGSFQQEFAEARQWEQFALTDSERQAARERVLEVSAREGRPLRLGIVSAELGQHAVAHFLASFLGNIDRKRLTVLLYPTTSRGDAETAPLRVIADSWSPLVGRSDAAAAAQIRAHGVDILLDTTGHTQHGRLGIFAHRAAPVQCHYIGYAGTTGLTEMDYFLADPVLIPEGLDAHFQETIWRLPRPWVAYAPLKEAPDPAWRPADDGQIHLGSFNNLRKLSDACLSLWSRVLRALPEAILLLKDKMALDKSVQQRIVDTLAGHGVAKHRVIFLPRVPDWQRHMALYDQLDIALDTIPFGSGTTGFDALWMGVPLITLAGSWMGGRMGASMLTGLGHPEWIAQTDDEYVAKVVSLGRDVELRTRLRATQRTRMRESPLCDGRDMARALEDAFEAMFDNWWTRNHTPSRQQAPSRQQVEVPSTAERETLVAAFHAGQLDEAELAARKLTERFPGDGFAWKVLGTVLAQQGRRQLAWQTLQTAIELLPHDSETHNTLGTVFTNAGCHDEAVTSYQRAVELQPDYAEAHYNLGNALKDLGQLEEAVKSYRRALEVKPDYTEAHSNVGNVLRALGRLDEAVNSYQRALEIRPDHANSHHNLGNAMQDVGRLDKALAGYQRALEIKPDDLVYRSNLLFLYAFSRVGGFQQEYEEARKWELFALSATERQAARDRVWENPVRLGRPLRLGIVSAELGQHAVSYFLTSFLSAIDRKRLTVLLYPTVLRSAAETEPLQALAEEWSPLFGQSDAEAAAHIRADGVDILLDTTGHTQHSRLGIFAHRAAPVQCHYIGYAGTTGLTEMDYFLADPVLIPKDLDKYFQETVWRLPRPWVAYAPLEEAPEPAWRPAADGRIRLGSFNNLNKLSDSCLSLWAQVLRALPEATLLLKDKMALDGALQRRVIDMLTRHGVQQDRVTFLPRVPDWQSHMALYDQLDIALDTVPFGSGTTGFDALWMGVPMVTFAGQWMGGRMGASLLTGLGHPEWIAQTDEDYVAKVVSLGRDAELRTRLRATQRERMRESPVCDGRGMARALEDAFEAMFDIWWKKKEPPSRRTDKTPSCAEKEAIVSLFNASRLGEAESAAKKLTLQFPRDGFAWKVLGTVLAQQGRCKSAWPALKKAIERSPHDAETHNTLGVVLRELGHLEKAVASYQQAVTIQPDYAEAHYNLGNAFSDMRRLEKAVTSYRRAVTIQSNFAKAHYNLGNALKDLGRHDEAVASYRWTVQLQPGFANAHNNLGNSLQCLGRLEEASASYQHAVAIKPDSADAHCNLGTVLQDLGRLEEAEASCLRALAIAPDHVEAHNNLGNVLRKLGRLDDAVTTYQRALAIQPNHANAHHNLGNAFQDLGRVGEAVASYLRAVAIQPDCAETHSSLGVALQDAGRLDEALAHYQQAVAIKPTMLDYRSNLLFLYAFARVGSFQQEYAEARQWEQEALTRAERQAAHERVFDHPARQGRPLRLGIASGELGQHAVANFLTAFLGAIDRKRFTVLLYPTTLRHGRESESLRALADKWLPLFGQSDAEAAAHIRADGVDILLDTTGHTKHCRLGIFAHRAAPVQCHYIGYAGTTGLTEMDYFLADSTLIPQEIEEYFQETVWRLPRPWVAYAPLKKTPEPAWCPAHDGRIRLGSFNNLRKLSDECLSLWAKVLRALPEATLLLKDMRALDRVMQERIVRTLAKHGVGQDRVAFLPKVPDWQQHMSLYDQLDIALDTIPFGSGTTGFDALWMGVPLITLAGSWMGGRMGASMLTGMGHPEWITRTDDEYVATVVSLGRDEKLRTRLRSTQRERMRQGPLCDGCGMARALEDAFEAMFDKWWAGRR
ncbi:MAG: tetratricopeptide repeat protein [Pirellulaceae bacterium]